MKYISKMNDTKVNSMSFCVEDYTSEQKMQAITLLPLQWHLQPFLLNSVRQENEPKRLEQSENVL